MRNDLKQARRPIGRDGSGATQDGVGGTITGGPMKPLDLMEILKRGTDEHGLAGAVSGAAQMIVSKRFDPDRGVALSDGTRIIFASMDDIGAPNDA